MMGQSSGHPVMAGPGLSMAWLRNYTQTLHVWDMPTLTPQATPIHGVSVTTWPTTEKHKQVPPSSTGAPVIKAPATRAALHSCEALSH